MITYNIGVLAYILNPNCTLSGGNISKDAEYIYHIFRQNNTPAYDKTTISHFDKFFKGTIKGSRGREPEKHQIDNLIALDKVSIDTDTAVNQYYNEYLKMLPEISWIAVHLSLMDDEYIISNPTKIETLSNKFLLLLNEWNSSSKDKVRLDYLVECLKCAAVGRYGVFKDTTTAKKLAAEYLNKANTQNRELLIASLSEPRVFPISVVSTYFKNLSKHGRFKAYRDVKKNERLTIRNRLITEESSTSKSLESIVFTEKGVVNSISLCGRGGCGKTHQMLGLIDTILLDPKRIYNNRVLPFYLPLNIFNNVRLDSPNNAVLECLTNEIRDKIDDESFTYETLKGILKCDTPYTHNYSLLLLDGFNEVTTEEVRMRVIDDIYSIISSPKYTKVRVVLSSRRDYSNTFSNEYSLFKKAEVLDLSEEDICEYFKQVEEHSGLKLPRYTSLPPETKKLLTSPQGLAMYVELMLDGGKNSEIDSLSKLIQCYIQRIVHIKESEALLHSKIAYSMVQHGKFKCSSEALSKALTGSTISQEVFLRNSESIFASSSSVVGLLSSYEYSHQNFRDYFSALYLANTLNSIVSMFFDTEEVEEAFSTLDRHYNVSSNAMNDEILILIAGLVDVQTIQTILTAMVEYGEYSQGTSTCVQYATAIGNLIRIVALKSPNMDISQLDFSGMDLTHVRLNGYKLYSKDSACSFDRATVSDTTFLNAGLENASSTVCQYTLDGKLYVVAFSRSNILIYDVKGDRWEILRDLHNGGWVNCCTPASIGGEDYVLLGCRLGCIVLFNVRTRLTVSVSVSTAEVCDIAIHGEYCLLSTSDGKFSAIPTSTLVLASNDTPPKATPRELYSFGKYSIPNVECRFTTSDSAVYLGCGSKVLTCKFDTLMSDSPNFTLVYDYSNMGYHEVQNVLYTNGLLYVNLYTHISCIVFDGQGSTAKVCYGTPSSSAISNGFKGFTKLSLGNTGEVICGVDATNFEKLPNLYLYSLKGGSLVYTEIQGRQRLKTYMSLQYKYGMGQRYIFSTSDDRSVEIIKRNDEDSSPVHYAGSYYGVHYIDAISPDKILTANYDGSVVLMAYSNGSWHVVDVYPIHNDWVWKVKYYPQEDGDYCISCSYDGTVRKTNLVSGTSTVLLKVNDVEKRVTDFCTTVNGNVLAITYDRVYVNGTDGTPKGSSLKLRCITDYQGDDILVAVNGRSTHKVLKYSNNNNYYDIIVAKKECGFIRTFRRYTVHHHTLLILAGNTTDYLHVPKNPSTEYFEIHLETTDGWKFLGANISSEIMDALSNRTDSNYNLIKYNRKSINDFTIDNPTYSKGKVQFHLFIVNKDSKMSMWKVTIDVETASMVSLEYINDWKVSSQPMCIHLCENRIYIGFLDGYIDVLDVPILLSGNVDYSSATLDTIRVHSNLIAKESVDLSTAIFESLEAKEQFKRKFSGYFNT